jgi:ABC-2 type transport system ATP-binding protein
MGGRGGGFVGGFGGGRGGVTSFSGLIRILRGTKGPSMEALRGVNLKIKEGEIFGVLGPNGAGKTTLIKILCTMVIQDEGEAYVYGFDVVKEPRKVLRNLQAVLPESRGFTWRLTGAQNLYFYALLYGLKKKEAEERIAYLLETTGMTERANDGYQRYSTGMQRKLLLCRAMLQNSPILLFDEPTAGLDPVSAAEFRGMLQKLVEGEKKTIFLSTHNLYEAQSLCDRVAILDHGKIIACDTPDNVRSMIVDEQVFTIKFIDAVFNNDQINIVNKLEAIQGVHGVTPELDHSGGFHGLSIHVDKDMDISGILDLIMKSGLKISLINTEEPTLEDAFIKIAGRKPMQIGDVGDHRRRA